MKRFIVALMLFCLIAGISAQNKMKVAVFDITGSNDEQLIKDIRNTFYWGIVDYKGLDAINIDEVIKVQKENNYQQSNDKNYNKAAKLGQQLGAQYVLLSNVKKDGPTYTIKLEMLDITKNSIIAEGKVSRNYKFYAAEQAFDNMLGSFGSIISTPTYDKSGWGQNFSETVAGIKFEMIFVEGGTFAMGSDIASSGKNEKPIHDVTLNSYYIGKTEVTFNLFDAYCKETGARKPSDESWGRGSHPVINVNKQDVLNFCKWLSKKTGKDYRLPTEAEWEYAARGGMKSKNKIYAGSNQLYDYGWFDRNSNGKTHPVGLKLPNELGIHDMCGNAIEICSDWYDANYYSVSPKNNPLGPKKGHQYVVRGGSYYDCPNSTRVAYRKFGGSDSKSCSAYLTGFRLVCVPDK